MRALLGTLALAALVALSACEQRTAEEAPQESPATTEPAPASPPRPAPAPAPQEQQGEDAAKSEMETRSLRVVATPVIVEVNRTQERKPANGGSAVVLFSDATGSAYRNLITCVNVWNLMDTATTQEVQVGIRKADDGTIEALRPLYWLNRTGQPANEQSCEERLARYDYVRARTIRDKYGLVGAGPYFVVARTDERAAAVIDLAGRNDREIADLVRYFRDGFAFQSDIWDPARSMPEKKRALLTTFFGPRFREAFVTSLGFLIDPVARAGCRLGDLKDAPCT
jgi:hypothetical protein